jgi:DNA-binding response OmpR family regulator
VWVYVSYLRRKLTGIGSTVVIAAHRNLGYSLEVAK